MQDVSIRPSCDKVETICENGSFFQVQFTAISLPATINTERVRGVQLTLQYVFGVHVRMFPLK